MCIHKDNQLAGKRQVCVGDLEGEKILLFDDRSLNKKLIDMKSAEYGFRPNIAYSSSDMIQLVGMANSGQGIVICIPTALQKLFPDLRLVAFTDRDMKMNRELIFREREMLSEETKVFMEYIISEANKT